MRAKKTGRLVAGTLTVAVGFGCLSSATATAADTASPHAGHAGHADTQAIVDGFVEQGAPGAMVFAKGRHGSWTVHSGTGMKGADRPIRPWEKVRAFSNTKMFTATVVLQLVDEGTVNLDTPIEEYLPGVVRGNGYDGNQITVRQLLQHTSGMGNYVKDVLAEPDANNHPWKPKELVRIGLSHPPEFAPGTDWDYSNVGYIVLGMLVNAVSGNDVGTEITDRIIRPLGLWQTRYPEPGEKRITGPHAHGYYPMPPSKQETDVTELEPSVPGSAAAVVSTAEDLTRFVRALLAGKVLSPERLAEMRDTMPTDYGSGFGLGIQEFPLPCGGVAWGHSGNGPGFDSLTAVTEDGRSAFGVANGHLDNDEPAGVRKAVSTALC